MFSYAELVQICTEISEKLDLVQTSIDTYLPKLLIVITLFVFLKVGFTCMKGIKV